MGKTVVGSAAVTVGLAALGSLFAVFGGLDGVDGATGFRDGFVAGYGQTCHVAGKPTEARWGNSSYSQAYVDGLAQGINACKDERRRTDDPPRLGVTTVAALGHR